VSTKLFLNWKCESRSIETPQLIDWLGSDPTDFWSEGEQVGSTKLRRKANGLQIEQQFEGSTDMKSYVKNFVASHHDNILKIRSLAPDIDITFTLALYSNEPEGLYLDWDIVEVLARTKSNLNYDLYVL
jgi:hypothetical protein